MRSVKEGVDISPTISPCCTSFKKGPELLHHFLGAALVIAEFMGTKTVDGNVADSVHWRIKCAGIKIRCMRHILPIQPLGGKPNVLSEQFETGVIVSLPPVINNGL